MTQIIIHAGLPKTGTTSIQAMLADEAEALQKRGVCVVVRGDATRQLRTAGFSALLRNGGFLGRSYYRRKARTFWNDVLKSDCRVVLVSDENLLGIRSRDMFDPSAKHHALVVAQQLRESLPEQATLKFVLYERDSEALHRSAWNQRRRKGSALSYDEWSSQFPDLDEAKRIIESMQDAFGQAVTVVKMEDEIANGRFLGEQVLAAAGVPDHPTPAKVYRENVGGR